MTLLDTNSRLKDFIIQKQLECKPNGDGLTFCIAKDEMNPTESEPIVTVRWTRDLTHHLKSIDTESFPADPVDFFNNKDFRAVTTLLAYSIMALYLAAGTGISTSKHIKVGFPQLKYQEFETASNVVPKHLREAVTLGTVPLKLAERAFSFTMAMLPSHIVDGNVSPHWVFPKFDQLADVSFVWLQTRWTSWSTVYEFHEAAPCGKGIYAWAAGGQKTKPLSVQIKNNGLAIAAIHDKIYKTTNWNLKNGDIFEAVCKDKAM